MILSANGGASLPVLLSSVLVGIGIVVAGVFLSKGHGMSDLVRNVTYGVILPALEQKLKDVEYRQRERISSELVKEADLIPYGGVNGWNNASGEDLVMGSYQGMRIQFSDMSLTHVESYRDDEGRRQTKVTARLLQGLWAVCDCDLGLSSDVRIVEKSPGKDLASLLKKVKSDVETENSAFNEQFQIKTDSPHDAFYVLTPHMMERLVSADRLAQGETHIAFLANGKVHIAINSGRDSFKFVWSKVADELPQTRQRIADDLRYVTDIIDELRLVQQNRA
jgi:hypothetical protein